ncbi:hypothetical protein M407DRAFT_218609 [Tulasnella calospora MUT 4182]|uniref:F-box domain-containing protein n=1 Tax=Tulasnella calospora MUT 4182 TaxID=1051891 RepID=A0A0C3LK29_9AGAM|nr:hypothetical protein M407DRAFT_218609 [Tulasnella calospora MUT 4182]
MSFVPAYVLQLSTEAVLEIIERIPNPLDILALSLASKWFAEIVRDEWTWRRHLALGAWNVDVIIRHSQTGAEGGTSDNIWIKLARAACHRWDVLHPGYYQNPTHRGWRLWERVARPGHIKKLAAVTSENDSDLRKLVAQPGYIKKLAVVTSEIDSDSPFFEGTEDVAHCLASHRPGNAENELISYQRLVTITRYMYHANGLLVPTPADVLLGKAFEPGYQQWPIIYSSQTVNRRDLSVYNMVADRFKFKRLCRSGDPRALRYINQALIILMALFKNMIWCVANQSPQGIDYRRALPRRCLPDTTWLTTSAKNFLPWIGPQGQSWWSLDTGPMILEGYYAYHSSATGGSPLDAPMTMTLLRGQNSDEFRGTGQDGVGDFSINGTVDGAVVTFHKRYQPWLSWQYSGILLPWALAGVWQRPESSGNPDGNFCLWLVE